jgi:hypothetical protein
LCITSTVEHNYILPSSTVRIQLHVSALCVDHLQVEIQLTDHLYKMCGMFVCELGEVGEGTRSRCFSSGYHDLGLLQVDFSLVVYVHCTSNTQNSLLLNQHNGDDAPQDQAFKTLM